MVRYTVKRVLMMIPIILIVTLILFILLYSLTGSSIRLMPAYGGGDALDSMFDFFGAGDNLFTKYIRYCYNVFFHLDLGKSGNGRLDVASELGYRVNNTLLLLASGVGVTLAAGIPIGVYCSMHKDSKGDRIINVVSLFFSSIPNYAVAMSLALIFSVYLRIIPVLSDYTTPTAFILPTLTITLGGVASVSRMTRASMLEVLEQPYITALRSKGLKEAEVVYSHALKNALIPVISILGGLISQLLFGTIVVEYFFNTPALGTYMLRAVSGRDHFAILGCTVVLAVILTVLNIVVDLLYAIASPQIRLRYSGKSGAGMRRGIVK